MAREMDRIQASHRTVLEQFLQGYPVKLGKIASGLGVEVKVSSLPTGISGQITKSGNTYVIKVNRNEARERQRFTIAHELAHFLLHREIIDSTPDGISDTVLYRSGAPERIEYEANRLASEIVMPSHLVSQIVEDELGGYVTDAAVEHLAKRFEVSRAAMEIKLGNLQLTG